MFCNVSERDRNKGASEMGDDLWVFTRRVNSYGIFSGNAADLQLLNTDL